MGRWILLIVVTGLMGCVARPPGGQPYDGVASWYGPGFHGRLTSNGEVYDQDGISAAHRTLPLGTRVRVTHLANGRSIVVRVNDRGPFVDGRDIDLSRGAAKALGMVQQGTAPVRLEPLLDGPLGIVRFAVQVGSFNDSPRANAMRGKVAELHPGRSGAFLAAPRNVYVARGRRQGRTVFRVRVGPYGRRKQAEDMAHHLRVAGLQPIVVEEVTRDN